MATQYTDNLCDNVARAASPVLLCGGAPPEVGSVLSDLQGFFFKCRRLVTDGASRRDEPTELSRRGRREHLAISRLSFTPGDEHIKPTVPGSRQARAKCVCTWECVGVTRALRANDAY